MPFSIADQITAEAMALAVLKAARQPLPFFPHLTQRVVLFQNPHVQVLDQTTIRVHPYIRHRMKIGFGGMPGEMMFEGVAEPARERLLGLIA